MIQGHSISTFSNFFFLETAWSIEAKFYVAPPWEAGLKVWSNGLGHMTKMAPMPIYDKKLKKSPWKLVCSIGYSSTSKFVQIMTQGHFMAKSNLVLYGKKVKQWIFWRNYVVYYIKCGRCWWSTKWVHENLWVPQVKVIHWHWSKSLRFNINFFSSIIVDIHISSALRWAVQDQWPLVFHIIYSWPNS